MTYIEELAKRYGFDAVRIGDTIVVIDHLHTQYRFDLFIDWAGIKSAKYNDKVLHRREVEDVFAAMVW